MISRPHRWRPWAALLVLAACTEPYEPSAPASPERYAVALAAAWCDYGVRCESPADAERPSRFCHPRVAEAELAELLERQPHRAFDAEAAARCLRTIEEAAATCSVPRCEPVLVGTRAAGEACDDDAQCAPGFFCDGPGGVRCSGSCASSGGEGAQCDRDAGCAEGLHCDGARCAPDGTIGAACRRSGECASGLDCDRRRGECFAPAAAVGRRCGDEDGAIDEGDPAADRCPVPTDCVDGTCQSYEPNRVAGPGEPCGSRACAASHFCDAGTCALRPGLTQPCDDEARCVEGRCMGGACRLLPPRAPCASDRECATDRCTRGRCEVPSAVGAPCSGDRDCADGLQCSDGNCVVRAPCG